MSVRVFKNKLLVSSTLNSRSSLPVWVNKSEKFTFLRWIFKMLKMYFLDLASRMSLLFTFIHQQTAIKMQTLSCTSLIWNCKFILLEYNSGFKAELLATFLSTQTSSEIKVHRPINYKFFAMASVSGIVAVSLLYVIMSKMAFLFQATKLWAYLSIVNCHFDILGFFDNSMFWIHVEYHSRPSLYGWKLR
jgi:hypothetical protein